MAVVPSLIVAPKPWSNILQRERIKAGCSNSFSTKTEAGEIFWQGQKFRTAHSETSAMTCVYYPANGNARETSAYVGEKLNTCKCYIPYHLFPTQRKMCLCCGSCSVSTSVYRTRDKVDIARKQTMKILQRYVVALESVGIIVQPSCIKLDVLPMLIRSLPQSVLVPQAIKAPATRAPRMNPVSKPLWCFALAIVIQKQNQLGLRLYTCRWAWLDAIYHEVHL